MSTPMPVSQVVKLDCCLKGKCPYLDLGKTPAECLTGEEPGPECSFNGELERRVE